MNYWGKRRLAYPIKNFTEGTYVLVQFQMEPEDVVELESSLKLVNEVIRHLVVKRES